MWPNIQSSYYSDFKLWTVNDAFFQLDQEEVEKLVKLYYSQVPDGFKGMDEVSRDKQYKRLLAIGMKHNFDYISHLMNHYQQAKFSKESIYFLRDYLENAENPHWTLLKQLSTFKLEIPTTTKISGIPERDTIIPYEYSIL